MAREELTETAPESIMSLSRSEIRCSSEAIINEENFRSKYLYYRHNFGTYPKWLAKIGRFILKFFFKRRISIVLRGRGERVKAAKRAGAWKGIFRQDLPLKYASKVACYITLRR